ncbi:hypothetical protein CBR_g32599 [Chara braunii]|uniref:Uncharacterized protein n=1 Tax=Chara braunii TaxID=69332 RepID=A0A388LH59_CHABU|nr:hypothetical protein CBR_g32599 [Chara braunii]|eukprot:GBG81607.1 hypothetical protein CBR_g32599 [Chara braunii]
MPSLDLPILLGRSFLCRSEALIMNKHDGTMFVILCDPVCGNFEVITCRNTGPHSSKNRLNAGSYTFEESENRRRELEWEGEEEESDDEEAKGLVLSLANISDVVELVSAYKMADADAIRALVERIQDDPEGGRVDLVYRPPPSTQIIVPHAPNAQAVGQHFLGVGSSRAPKGGTRRRDPWKEEAMTQKGAMAGTSGLALRKGGQRRELRVSRNLEELPIYRAGDMLKVFLRDLEEYAFRREWGDMERIANVKGAGMYKRRIEGVVACCTRWKVCKVMQDQTRKERLQKKGLWIGRGVTEPQGKEEKNEEEDNVPLKVLKNKARISPKSSSKESEQAEGNEQDEEEAAEERKKSMGASMVPRKKKLGKRRAIKSGRREIQERVSEKGEGVEEVGEGKKVQGGGKAPKVKRTEGKRPIGNKEETSEIRKKEDEKDGQVEKLIRDMEEMRKEVRELKKEKEELQKKMRQLRVSLNVQSRELENEVDTRAKMKIRVDGLVSEVSVLGQDLDDEISERKKLGQEWEERWEKILRRMKKSRLSQQGKEKEATKMVGRKGGEEKGAHTEKKKEELPAPKKEKGESVAIPLPGQVQIKYPHFELNLFYVGDPG